MTSILFIAPEGEYEFIKNRFVIEAMLSGCKETKVELLVLLNSSNQAANDKLQEYFLKLIESPKFDHCVKVGTIEEMTLSESTAYNKLLKEAKGEHICLFHPRSMVKKGWLYELEYFYSLIENPGACAIPLFSDKKVYSPLLDKNDDLIEVYKTENNAVSGIVYIKTELARQMLFDDKVETGAAQEISAQLAKCGHNNFYIPKHLRKLI